MGTLDDLVINVRDITHIGDFISAGTQVPGNHIEHDHDAGMPHVTVVIDRHATDIHTDLARFDRFEFFFFPGQGVINA